MTTEPRARAAASRAAAALWAMIRRPVVAASLAVTVLSATIWIEGSTYIEDFSSTLNGIRQLVAADRLRAHLVGREGHGLVGQPRRPI